MPADTLYIADRVRVGFTTAPGATAQVPIGPAKPGYRSFADVGLTGGQLVPYVLEDGIAWEIGLGAYDGTNFSRTTIQASSNGGARIAATAAAEVYISLTQYVLANPPDFAKAAISDATLVNAFVGTATITTATATTATIGDLTITNGVTGNGVANSAQYTSATGAARVLTIDSVWKSGVEIAVPYAASVAPDLGAFINARITLTGNIVLANATNAKPGQSGRIRLIQDATGSRTISYGSAWKKASADTNTLSTTAGAIDILYYDVIDASNIVYSIKRAVA